MPFVCVDHATVLFLQGSPVSYLRRSNSDAAFTLKDFALYVLCVSAVLFSVVIFCMLHAGRLQKKMNFETLIQKNLGIRLRLEIVGKFNTYTSDIFPYHQKIQPFAS